MSPLISIIVPVYNAEPYLRECIDSILSQTVKDIEVILVDDGSTDNSGIICDSYQSKDSRVCSIHKKNGGSTDAVRTGYAKANGEWLFFVDADDSITDNALSLLLSHATEDTNIVVGFSYEGGGSSHTINAEEWRQKMVHGDPILCTRWGKLYRHEVFSDDCFIDYPGIVVGEDMIMNISVALRNQSPITIIESKIYNYRQPSTSLTSSYLWTADKYATLYSGVLCAISNSCDAYLQQLINNGIGMIRDLCISLPVRNGHINKSTLQRIIIKDISICSRNLSIPETILIYHPDCMFTRLCAKLQRRITIAKQFIMKHIR